MFTGIVDAVGRVAKATRETGNGKRAEGLALTIQSRYRGVKKGESIAVNGACLTVEKVLKGSFTHKLRHIDIRFLGNDLHHTRGDGITRWLRCTNLGWF